ncbi:hypothetical protein HMPREF9467_01429 [ [[Clostridium] clostridioforme 2_1_49FAA]|uniref:Uncharacterized protein n=3 Tax=Enterocloster clostridioformis TaxID=1531 RepID=A0A0E2HB37_9FIRM|nr:hypothetical protein HMPREF9467_01429 [ [[Clostridium] clostridioforme 2_1_49FAA]ENZ14100.1 hypothetical protein HMPREF1090_02392 [[Clostridium] clostridioforme 90A8]
MGNAFLLKRASLFLLLSAEKIGDYYMGVRRILTNIFGQREVLAYVTSTEKTGGSRRLFFSTIFPEQMQIFCVWQEKAPLNQTGSERMQFIPLLCYTFRWNIEVSYYEQKVCRNFGLPLVSKSGSRYFMPLS